MSRLKRLFRRLRKERRCGFIAYVTCGDPDIETTVRVVLALEQAGADAIELGIPFSDPIADGPVIQAAAQRALQRGTTIYDVFSVAKRVREKSDIPLIAFSYVNPVMRYGAERFTADAEGAGLDSMLLTDLPAEAASELRNALRAHRMGGIFLLAPTSTAARIAEVNRVSDDFIYYVSTTGVTGSRSELEATLIDQLDAVRGRVSKPLAVGFGISEHKHYEALRNHCDAIVVGSAIVRAIADGDTAGAPQRAADVVRRVLGRA